MESHKFLVEIIITSRENLLDQEDFLNEVLDILNTDEDIQKEVFWSTGGVITGFYFKKDAETR